MHDFGFSFRMDPHWKAELMPSEVLLWAWDVDPGCHPVVEVQHHIFVTLCRTFQPFEIGIGLMQRWLQVLSGFMAGQSLLQTHTFYLHYNQGAALFVKHIGRNPKWHFKLGRNQVRFLVLDPYGNGAVLEMSFFTCTEEQDPGDSLTLI